MTGMSYGIPVQLRQSVHIIIARSRKTEILRQVDNPDMCGHLVCLQELFALSVTETEEDHIYFFQWQFIRKHKVCLAVKPFMHIGNPVPCIARTVDKFNLRFRRIQQYAAEFAGRIAGSSDDSYFYHTPPT